MDSKKKNTSESVIESVQISYDDDGSRSTAKFIHNFLFKQLRLKTKPPQKIRRGIAGLGIPEILITIVLTSIAKDLWGAILNLLKKASETQILKNGDILIKFDDNDVGKRFPFQKDTNWEKLLKIIEKYIAQRHKKNGETLLTLIERRIEIDDMIAKLFETDATFLDIDVVSSTDMSGVEPDLIVSAYSFELYHKYVKEKVEENRGMVLDANGDEVMAWFGIADNAINCAMALFRDRNQFNKERNRLKRPFQFRIGINSGRALIDIPNGKAFAKGVLHFAGHLQKAAEPGTFLISEETYKRLDDKSRFQQIKFIKKDKKWSFILVG